MAPKLPKRAPRQAQERPKTGPEDREIRERRERKERGRERERERERDEREEREEIIIDKRWQRRLLVPAFFLMKYDKLSDDAFYVA